MALLLEHFGECTIRVTVLLKYLDHVFSICGCLLFYNSLIFACILLSFGRGSFLSLVHLHSNLKLIPPCNLCDIDGNLEFLNCARSMVHFFTKVAKLLISCLLFNRFLTTKKALL